MPKTHNANGGSHTSGSGNSPEHSPENHAVSSQRRKLIKASAAAVPAIMTLRSGAAAAAASLHYCMDKDAARASTILTEELVLGDDPSETALDEWVRVVGKAGRMVTVPADPVGGSDSVYYCIKNTDLPDIWDNVAGYNCFNANSESIDDLSDGAAIRIAIQNNWNAASNFNFYCVFKDSAWECVVDGGGQMIPPIVTPTINANDIDAGKDVYLLVYVRSFDHEITDATYYPNIALMKDQELNPITASCLCSVDPDFNILG